jgi:hypothetical protein
MVKILSQDSFFNIAVNFDAADLDAQEAGFDYVPIFGVKFVFNAVRAW